LRLVPVALGLVVIAYVLCFGHAAYVRFLNFHFSQDGANFNHMLWRTVHGDFLPSYLYGKCHLGDHASFFLVMLVPIYALAPSMRTLLYTQSAFIGLAAIPFFLIARRALRSETAALAAAVAWLFHPGVVSQNLNQVHEVQFVIGFLLAAFYCFQTRRFRWFVVFSVLAAAGKETVPLTVFMFGAYALIRRRPLKWVLFPTLFSVLYLVLVVGVLMPALWGGGYRHVHHFSGYGRTLPEILGTMLFHPRVTFAIVAARCKAVYALEVLGPAGLVLPLMGSAIVLAVPDFVINVLASEPALAVVEWHYSVIVATFVSVAAAQAIGGVASSPDARGPGLRLAGLMGLWLALTAAGQASWRNVADSRPPRDWQAREAVLARIPDDPNVSVLAPQSLVARLTERYTILTTEQGWADLAAADYIIVDEGDPRRPMGDRLRVHDAVARGGHRLVWRSAAWRLYSKADHARTRRAIPRPRVPPGGD